MRVLILGAAGMIGGKLAAQLAREGHLAGQEIEHMTLFDRTLASAPPQARIPVEVSSGDLSQAGQAEQLLATQPTVIFHLAAIVSGEAERDFDTGYRVNLDGTRLLLEAIRAAGDCPKLIFTSSIAVFGPPYPESISDEFHLAPRTSYGTQKAICELLISDYSRRGFVDGLALRFPTICVRPGKPNGAASSFFSSIIREPLQGLQAVLPVGEEIQHWHASPRAAVGFLLHAAALDNSVLGPHRALSLPGVTVSVGEQIAALRRVAGDQVAQRIVRQPDPFIQRIVGDWPHRFDAQRAQQLGFRAETNFDEIIRVHIEDELQGVIR
ncbi:MAG: SDR family oxidoreductase [Planctomycetales bacterium]|nr:SDR family oxidoreductase [Planctomycetales bacterium]